MTRTPNHNSFFTYVLILFQMHYMAVLMFRGAGAVAQNMVAAYTVGSFLLLLCFLLGGFLISKRARCMDRLDMPNDRCGSAWMGRHSYARVLRARAPLQRNALETRRHAHNQTSKTHTHTHTHPPRDSRPAPVGRVGVLDQPASVRDARALRQRVHAPALGGACVAVCVRACL